MENQNEIKWKGVGGQDRGVKKEGTLTLRTI